MRGRGKERGGEREGGNVRVRRHFNAKSSERQGSNFPVHRGEV